MNTNNAWANTHLSRLLPVDEESLKQIIDYSLSLSKEAAAEHLKNLLGDSPQALEFITSFNSRRDVPKDSSDTLQSSEVPRRPRKKKAPLNKLPPPRRPEDYGNTEGAYQKKDENDYMSGAQRSRKEPALSNTLALSDTPSARQLPIPTATITSSAPNSRTASPKPPPSAAGALISSFPNVRTTSRANSPNPTTKIAVSGGTSMHGASTTLNDLDSAIRALEIQTNPSLSSSTDTAARRCTCLATRHPLLATAPNCLNCGKIICVKEGIGPCTFCSYPLLSSSEIQSMVRVLREERGKEKMDLNNSSQRRAEISKTPRAFQQPLPPSANRSTESENDSLAQARTHKDKLLTYQAQNARRTHVIDEAADFETPTTGQSMWASPVERAAQLKRQQKVLREQEWNAKPEYEKRRVVLSVDLVGGKVVRRMGERRRGEDEDLGDDDDNDDGNINGATAEQGGAARNTSAGTGTGAFGKNPLLGSLIRPIWSSKDGAVPSSASNSATTSTSETRAQRRFPKTPTWRRVQDDNEDNEAWILDGGVYGGREEGRKEEAGMRRLGVEERAGG